MANALQMLYKCFTNALQMHCTSQKTDQAASWFSVVPGRQRQREGERDSDSDREAAKSQSLRGVVLSTAAGAGSKTSGPATGQRHACGPGEKGRVIALGFHCSRLQTAKSTGFSCGRDLCWCEWGKKGCIRRTRGIFSLRGSPKEQEAPVVRLLPTNLFLLVFQSVPAARAVVLCRCWRS